MNEFDEFMKALEDFGVLSGWSKFMDDKKTQDNEDVDTTEDE